MKYSIIGKLNGIVKNSVDEQAVIDKLNSFNPIWRMIPSTYEEELMDGSDGTRPVMTFEVWLGTIEDKDLCFSDMKAFVDTYTGNATWHICTHDEVSSQPCQIQENYIV